MRSYNMPLVPTRKGETPFAHGTAAALAIKNMYTHIVKGGGDPDQLYISELRMQCILAKSAYKHLAKYCEVVGDNKASVEPLPYSPLDIVAQCTLFLSAVATISKILFPADTKVTERGERLRKRLKVQGEFLGPQSRAVRNSFEHIDERIDALLPQHENDDVCFYDIDDQAPKQSLVLKRLDPRSRKIEFLQKGIDIEACHNEVLALERAL